MRGVRLAAGHCLAGISPGKAPRLNGGWIAATMAVMLGVATVRAASPLAPTSFSILLAPGVAPCAIHVNALPLPLAVGTPLTTRYDWDFGDPHSEFNHLTGWTAAHWYDHPGNYTLSLKLTDQAGTIHTYAAHLTIEPNTRWATYVSPEGNDANDGFTAETPVRSLAHAAKLLKDDHVVLFKAGATYDVARAFGIKARDVAFGRYGIGPDPILRRLPGNGSDVFNIDRKSDGVLFRHLVFDSPHAVAENAKADKVSVDAVHAAGQNVAVRDCTFLNVDDGVNANGAPTGLLVQDCKAPLINGLRAYLVWGQGSDLVALGNHAANSTREHIIRMTGITRVLIAYNDFTNLDRQSVDKYDIAKGTIECHGGSYFYVTQNTVHDGTIRLGPLGLYTNTETTDWAVVDGNTLTNTYLPIYTGTHHAVIRNNVIAMDRHVLIDAGGDNGKGLTTSDITVVNNTGISQADYGQFLKVSSHIDGMTVRNNLFVAPHLKPYTHTTAVLNIGEPDLSSFKAVDHNVWPLLGGDDRNEMLLDSDHKGTYCSAQQWLKFPQVKDDTFADVTLDAQLAPVGDTPAVRQGVPTAGVWQDRNQQPRPATGLTVGAVQLEPRSAPSEAPGAK